MFKGFVCHRPKFLHHHSIDSTWTVLSCAKQRKTKHKNDQTRLVGHLFFLPYFVLFHSSFFIMMTSPTQLTCILLRDIVTVLSRLYSIFLTHGISLSFFRYYYCPLQVNRIIIHFVLFHVLVCIMSALYDRNINASGSNTIVVHHCCVGLGNAFYYYLNQNISVLELIETIPFPNN